MLLPQRSLKSFFNSSLKFYLKCCKKAKIALQRFNEISSIDFQFSTIEFYCKLPRCSID